MRNPAQDEYDKKELRQLNPQVWMLELLDLSPEYTHWGPHEDYMWNDKGGWDAGITEQSWANDGPFSLDELNEVVNFYFELDRESEECEMCGGTGSAPFARELNRSFYDFEEEGNRWCDDITQDDVDVLWEAGRLRVGFEKKPTAAQVNAWNAAPGLGHDAINRWVMIDARCKELGHPTTCEHCHDGAKHTAPTAHVNFIIWVLHPRKGCSRGVEYTNIQREDLPSIFDFLRDAAMRNAERFSKVVHLAEVKEGLAE